MKGRNTLELLPGSTLPVPTWVCLAGLSGRAYLDLFLSEVVKANSSAIS
jgi:hypothetical protein